MGFADVFKHARYWAGFDSGLDGGFDASGNGILQLSRELWNDNYLDMMDNHPCYKLIPAAERIMTTFEEVVAKCVEKAKENQCCPQVMYNISGEHEAWGEILKEIVQI